MTSFIPWGWCCYFYFINIKGRFREKKVIFLVPCLVRGRFMRWIHLCHTLWSDLLVTMIESRCHVALSKAGVSNWRNCCFASQTWVNCNGISASLLFYLLFPHSRLVIFPCYSIGLFSFILFNKMPGGCSINCGMNFKCCRDSLNKGLSVVVNQAAWVYIRASAQMKSKFLNFTSLETRNIIGALF